MFRQHNKLIRSQCDQSKWVTLIVNKLNFEGFSLIVFMYKSSDISSLKLLFRHID